MKNLFVINTPFHLLSAFILTKTIYQNDENYLALVRSHGYAEWDKDRLMQYLSSQEAGYQEVFPLIYWLSSKKKDNVSLAMQAQNVKETIGRITFDRAFLGCDVDPYNQLLLSTIGIESFYRMDDGMYSYSYAEKRRNLLHQTFHRWKASYMKRKMKVRSDLPINTVANGESLAGKGDFLYLPELLKRYSPQVIEITTEQIQTAMQELAKQNLYTSICPNASEKKIAVYLSQGRLKVEEEVSVLERLKNLLGETELIYKPHPNDSIDKLAYIRQHLPNVMLCDSKIPVEIMLYFEKNITTVIGYQSTTLVLARKFTGRDIDCISVANLYDKQTIHPVYLEMMKTMRVRFIE